MLSRFYNRTGEDLTDPDVAKLHNEVNQLVMQRFLVTMAAITAFFAGITIILTRSFGNSNTPLISCFGSICINIFLTTMFWYLCVIRKKMRILTSYMRITGLSNWEYHYFSLKGYSECNKGISVPTYTNGQCAVFIVLTAASTIIPCLYAYSYDNLQNSSNTIISTGWFGLICAGAIIILRVVGSSESDAEKSWLRLFVCPKTQKPCTSRCDGGLRTHIRVENVPFCVGRETCQRP